jgi:hypothetical protein
MWERESSYYFKPALERTELVSNTSLIVFLPSDQILAAARPTFAELTKDNPLK